VVRFVVESLKADNWLFFGVPTAQIVAAITVIGSAVILVIRHSRSARIDPDGSVLDTTVGPA
jgi:hypothetical protein